MLKYIICNRSCRHPNIGIGKIVGNHAAPAICSKLHNRLHLCHRNPVVASTHLSFVFVYHRSEAEPSDLLFRLDNSTRSSRPTRFSSATTLPTSCDRSRVVIKSASSVSTTTRPLTPTSTT